MGTMSERLPSTHISSTHEPNKEKENAKVKRERENLRSFYQSIIMLLFIDAFSKVAQKVVVQNFSFLLFCFVGAKV